MWFHKDTAESSVSDLKLRSATAWAQIPRLPFPNTVVSLLPTLTAGTAGLDTDTAHHLKYSILSQRHLVPL